MQDKWMNVQLRQRFNAEAKPWNEADRILLARKTRNTDAPRIVNQRPVAG
jgi:hypothetical protein